METLHRQKALELFAAIDEALQDLVRAVRDACRGVVIYELPKVEADERVPTRIAVSPLGSIDRVEEKALETACAALMHYHRLPGQKNTTSYRLPGVIVLRRDVSEQMQLVNRQKDALQAHLISCYPDTIARSRVCSRLFPGMHMNHVYRHVHQVPPNIRRLNFTWQCQTPADVWISPAEAIELTEKAIEEESRQADSTQVQDRLKALKIALRYFSRLPTPTTLTEAELEAHPERIPFQLVRRNHVRPHPRVQMFDPEQGTRPLHTHAANLPLLAHSSGHRLDVRALRDYEAGRSRKRSDTKQGFREISQVLHIHGGYPSVDNYRRRLMLKRKADERARRRDAVSLQDN